MTDRRDAQVILKSLLEDRVPRIWVPSVDNTDLRQPLWYRHGASTYAHHESATSADVCWRTLVLEMSAVSGEVMRSTSLAASHEFTLTFLGISSSEHLFCDAVWSHSFLLELLRVGTRRRAVKPIDSAAESAKVNGWRCRNEVNLPAPLAHDAHMDWHEKLPCRASPHWSPRDCALGLSAGHSDDTRPGFIHSPMRFTLQ